HGDGPGLALPVGSPRCLESRGRRPAYLSAGARGGGVTPTHWSAALRAPWQPKSSPGRYLRMHQGNVRYPLGGDPFHAGKGAEKTIAPAYFFDSQKKPPAPWGRVNKLLADASEKEGATLLKNTIYRRYGPGDPVVTAGARDQSLYLVLE